MAEQSNVTQAMTPARLRLPWLDQARGAAVLGMIVFHAGWDAAAEGLLGAPVVGPAWQMFGHVVAASFLAISGFSLALGLRNGRPLAPVLRRIGLVFAAALAITAATRIAMPDGTIYFGILHSIAVGNVLALLLWRVPGGIVALFGLGIVVLPLLDTGWLPSNPWWVWLGLSGPAPATLDYRPLVPWAGVLLLGTVVGRLWPWRDNRPAIGGRLGPAFKLMGRHSFLIYLLHQAVLYPTVALLAQGLGTHGGDWLKAFESRCVSTCGETGATAAICLSSCSCARARVEATPLATELRSRPATTADRDSLGRIAGTCFAETAP